MPTLFEPIKVGKIENELDQSTFYAQGEKGYTDYPTLERASSA